MALIKCPECDTDVSDKALACPRCAHPIAEVSTKKTHAVEVQAIEKRGKKYLLQILIAVFLILAGFLLVIFNISGQQSNVIAIVLGLLVTVGGVIWVIIAEFSSWWRQR